MKTNEFAIRSYSNKELAACYHCSANTFRKWMKQLKGDLGPRMGHIYSPKQVRIIVERLGEP